jgi:hypothetical protein
VTGASLAGPKRSTFLLMSDFERLEEWCRNVRLIFDRSDGVHGPFLVGSAGKTAKYRDVDLRLIFADELYDASWDRVSVRLMNRAMSIWGQQETGLPIDFQIQRMTEANEQFHEPRNPMGLRDWSLTPTSGIPK